MHNIYTQKLYFLTLAVTERHKGRGAWPLFASLSCRVDVLPPTITP